MIVLPDLPYAYDALEPIISERTMRAHHDKHHARYVDVANQLLADVRNPGETLQEVVVKAWLRSDRKLFDNAAQALNHGIFWAAMSPHRAAASDAFTQALDRAFDGKARERFIAEGVGHFGSGWVWLASDNGSLTILATHDADTLARMAGLTPLLVCDVWEHAYYLDHVNDRAAYLARWWDHLANWTFAGDQYAASLGQGAFWAYPALAAAKPASATG